MTMPQVPKQPRSRLVERRALLLTIVIVAVILLGWLAYREFGPKAPVLTTDQQHQAILDRVVADSAAIHVSDADKAAILNQVIKESTPTPPPPAKKGATAAAATSATPAPLSAEQKAAILQSVSAQ